MKKIHVFLIVIIFTFNSSYAQWTTQGGLTFSSPGEVSIGTSTPWGGYNFALQGSYILGTAGDSPAGSIGGMLMGDDSGFGYVSNKFTDWFMFVTDSRISLGDVGYDQNNTNILLEDNLQTITSNAFNGYSMMGGPFGVGSVAPISNFQVNDNNSMASIGDASGAALNYGTSYLGFNAARKDNWYIHSDTHHNGGGVIYTSILNGEIYFAPIENTGTTDKTLSDADIKARIAFRITPTATYAKQLIVETTSWPDFVFKKNYSLMPLSSVKAYIDQNHHLPDIPSDEQVKKDGINLRDMNVKLLKKIEELTLYIIEKDKQINALQKTQSRINKKLSQHHII